MLFCVDGTALETLHKEIWIYVTLAVYIITRVVMIVRAIGSSGDKNQWLLSDVLAIDQNDNASEKNFGILGNAVSFLLLFYVYQAYQRFDTQYKASMVCEGRIFDICGLLRGAMMSTPNDGGVGVVQKDAALRIHRYLNAMVSRISGLANMVDAGLDSSSARLSLANFLAARMLPSYLHRISSTHLKTNSTLLDTLAYLTPIKRIDMIHCFVKLIKNVIS